MSLGVTPTLGEDLFPSSSSSDLVTGFHTLLVLLAIFKCVPGLLLGKMELGTLPRSMCHVSDTDSGKGPFSVSRLDPTWWSVFSFFSVFWPSRLASRVLFL